MPARRSPVQDASAVLPVADRRGRSLRTLWAPAVLGGFCVLTLPLSACAGSIGSSGTSNAGKAETAFADRVEEQSGGNVTLDIGWGSAVALYNEVTEAVADERLDLGVTVPRPAHFEFSNALICSSPVATADDLDGLQVRAGSSNDFALAEGVDAGVLVCDGVVRSAAVEHCGLHIRWAACRYRSRLARRAAERITAAL